MDDHKLKGINWSFTLSKSNEVQLKNKSSSNNEAKNL